MNLHKANCQMSSLGWAASIPPECTCNSPSDAGTFTHTTSGKGRLYLEENMSYEGVKKAGEQSGWYELNPPRTDAGVKVKPEDFKDMKWKVKVEVSPRIDWCGACKKEHGYDCPFDEVKPPPTESWAERFDEEFNIIKDDGSYSTRDMAIKSFISQLLRTERESYQKELVERTQSVNTHNKSGNDILIEVAEIIRSLN